MSVIQVHAVEPRQNSDFMGEHLGWGDDARAINKECVGVTMGSECDMDGVMNNA